MARSLKEELRVVGEDARRYYGMPLENRLEELRKLKQRKKGLERAATIIDTRIMLLEHMPDIAEQKVLADTVCVSILRHLNEQRQPVPYGDLLTEETAYNAVVFNRIYWLELAKLIRINPRNNWDIAKITLTKRGRNLQYAEQTH